MLAACLEATRAQNPRIHCITNAVSASLTANGLISVGGAPIMADAPEEVAEITALCAGLSLNLGMPNPRKLAAMQLAGQTANRKGIPVVFDPVGVGASQFRRDAAQTLLQTVQCTAMRGNLSEMKVLAGQEGHCLGVDAGDFTPTETHAQVVDFAKAFAQKTGAIIAISAAVDVVTDGKTAYVLSNGHPMLSALSGSGCLLSAMLAAYLAANSERPLHGAVAALCAMGYCGERAAAACAGTGSFAPILLDALQHLNGTTLEQEAKYELF